jgi:hypothetical protein
MQPRARRGVRTPSTVRQPRRRPLQTFARGGAHHIALHDFQIVERDSQFRAELFQLLLERTGCVVLLLTLNVPLHESDSVWADGKRAEPPLPSEHRNAFAHPVAGGFFHLPDHVGQSARGTESSHDMNVVFDSTDIDIAKANAPRDASDVGVKVRTQRAIQKRTAAPRREDHVDVNDGVCVHGSV